MTQVERQIEIYTNAFNLKSKPNWTFFQYRVDFSPDIDGKQLRIKLLESVLSLKEAVFDGQDLFVAKQIKKNEFKLIDNENKEFRISLRQTGVLTLNSDDNKTITRVLNIIFKKCLTASNFQRIGRKRAYFYPERINFERYSFSIANGFATAIDLFPHRNLFLSIDVANKIISNKTVLDTMRESNFSKSRCNQEIVSQTVMTYYNNRLYKVDGIAWDSNPSHTFEIKNSSISYLEYYNNHYGIHINDKNQPLLVSNPTKRDIQAGRTKPIYLIPELCNLTGKCVVKENMDVNSKRDMDFIMKSAPHKRYENIMKLVNEIKNKRETLDLLENWRIELNDQLFTCEANLIKKKNIVFKDKIEDPEYFDQSLKHNKHISTVKLEKWHLFYLSRDDDNADDFIGKLLEISKPMGFEISIPIKKHISGSESEFAKAVRAELSKCRNSQFVVCITPNNSKSTYNELKKICSLEFGIPSQMVISNTFRNKRAFPSVVTKIAIQMNCKLGGEIWGSNIALSNVMVIGIDVFHHLTKPSVVGFVASYNQPTQKILFDNENNEVKPKIGCTKWYSHSIEQMNGQEYIDSLTILFTEALQKYQEFNSKLPDKIFIYRDGVSDGQIDIIKEFEVSQIKQAISLIPDYDPKFIFLVVQKTGITRFFVRNERRIENPTIGTVVDKSLVKNEGQEFYMISQKTRQGTVKPTHYHIIENTTELSLDKIEAFSLMLTQLYYNYPGYIRVPAPCLYAHKLAYFHGNTLENEITDMNLRSALTYL